MINRPARALLAHPAVGRLVVLTQAPELFAADPATAWLAEHPKVRFERSGGGIASSLIALLDRGDLPFPLLMTTAAHVLRDGSMLDQMVRESSRADIPVAMVERRTVLASYPGSRSEERRVG